MRRGVGRCLQESGKAGESDPREPTRVNRRTMTRREATAVAMVTAVMLAVSGCGTTIAGTATAPTSVSRSSSAAPLPPGVDVGDNPTTLYAPEQGNVESAWIAEGNRMLEMLIQPSDADPTITELPKGREPIPSISLIGSETLPVTGSSAAADAKVGIALSRADRQNDPTKQVRMSAVRFATNAEADQALSTMRTASNSDPSVTILNLTNGFAGELEPGAVDVLFVRGAILLNVHVKAETVQRSTELAADLYSRQAVAVSRFKPTETDQVTSLPLDRDGVLARALSLTGPLSDTDRPKVGLLTLPAFERRVGNDPVIPFLREAGADLIGWNLGVVIRLRDESAALRFLEQGRAISKRKRIDGVVQIGDPLQCTQGAGAADNACTMVVGRYFAQVRSSDATVARQMAAAQWVILTRNP